MHPYINSSDSDLAWRIESLRSKERALSRHVGERTRYSSTRDEKEAEKSHLRQALMHFAGIEMLLLTAVREDISRRKIVEIGYSSLLRNCHKAYHNSQMLLREYQCRPEEFSLNFNLRESGLTTIVDYRDEESQAVIGYLNRICLQKHHRR